MFSQKTEDHKLQSFIGLLGWETKPFTVYKLDWVPWDDTMSLRSILLWTTAQAFSRLMLSPLASPFQNPKQRPFLCPEFQQVFVWKVLS